MIQIDFSVSLYWLVLSTSSSIPPNLCYGYDFKICFAANMTSVVFLRQASKQKPSLISCHLQENLKWKILSSLQVLPFWPCINLSLSNLILTSVNVYQLYPIPGEQEKVKVLVTQLCRTLCDSMGCSLPRLLCLWNSPGKNTGMGWYLGLSHFTCVLSLSIVLGLPRWHSGKETACQCRRRQFDPWVKKIPWRRKWQPTLVSLPGKSHGQRSLAGYSPLGHKESKRTKQLSTATCPQSLGSKPGWCETLCLTQAKHSCCITLLTCLTTIGGPIFYFPFFMFLVIAFLFWTNDLIPAHPSRRR